MANTTNVNIRMDKELRDSFEAFCKEVGMSVTTAFCLFAKKTVAEGKIPFEISVSVPNAETRAALAEYEEMKHNPVKYTRYNSFDELVCKVAEDVEDYKLK